MYSLGESFTQATRDGFFRLDEFVPRQVAQVGPGLNARRASDFKNDGQLMDLVLTLEHRPSCEQLEEDATVDAML